MDRGMVLSVDSGNGSSEHRGSDSRTTLVTGGAGFIGSHLCEMLLLRSTNVICADNLSTGSVRNVAHLLRDQAFKLIEHDITQPLFVDISQVYNLACPASPVQYQVDPIHTMKTCVLGTLHVLGLAKRNGARILQASTSEVYGDPQCHPQSEAYWGNVNPTGPRACYDEGKRAAETLLFDYHRQHRVRIKVARIFNTYGPRMHPHDGRVVSTLIVQALLGRPLPIQGDGRQTRSFCYVDDLVDGLERLMGSPEDVIGPVNLGNAHECSVLDLAERVLALTGSKSELRFLPAAVDDPTRRRPDLTLAEQWLGWRPKVSLEEGLLRTIAYFDDLLRAEMAAAPDPALRASRDRVLPSGRQSEGWA
jgi:UDP-glucuronate decarboxylase